MANYPTLDYLPVLQPSERASAAPLVFNDAAANPDGWQHVAKVTGYDQYASVRETFWFNAIAGAKYQLTSVSFNKPFIPEIYDDQGRVIAVDDDKTDDGAPETINGVSYNKDVLTWVAPYTGKFYVNASWYQSTSQPYHSLTLQENASQVFSGTSITPDKTSVDEGQGVLYTIKTWTLAPGTVLNWIATGIDAADSYGGTSGTVTISPDGTAVIYVSLGLDRATEGPETMRIVLGDSKGTVLATADGVTVNDTSLNWKLMSGTAGNDILRGSDGPDEISGFSGDDVLIGGAGDDLLHGGGGIDVAQYAGPLSNFTISKTTTGLKVADKTGAEGVDQLDGVEILRFADAAISYDMTGNAAKAYRLYQAAFDRPADRAGLGYWIDYLDKGGSVDGMAAGFVNSSEFKSIYGDDPSNVALLSRLYQNILHRTPDQSGFDYWLGVLDGHKATVSEVLASFSESSENQVALIGVVGSGITYTPYH